MVKGYPIPVLPPNHTDNTLVAIGIKKVLIHSVQYTTLVITKVDWLGNEASSIQDGWAVVTMLTYINTCGLPPWENISNSNYQYVNDVIINYS